MVSKYLIYGLIDPRDLLIHYVGKSSTGMSRPSSHHSPSRRQSRGRGGPSEAEATWLDELDAQGLKYVPTVLEFVTEPKAPSSRCPWWKGVNATSLNDAERWWIAFGRTLGWPLLNIAEGGAGGMEGDLNPSKRPEVIDKIRESRSGYRHNDTTKQKIREAQLALGERHPSKKPEVRERRRQAWSNGKSPTKNPVVAAKVSAALTGREFSDETRSRMSESATKRWRNTPETQNYMRGDTNPAKSPEARKKIGDAIRAAAARRPPPPCGTTAGRDYARKRKRQGLSNCGPCSACKRAAADYEVKRNALKRLAEWYGNVLAGTEPEKPALSPCGTVAAYTRATKYKRDGKPNCGPCESCRVAWRAYQTEYTKRAA